MPQTDTAPYISVSFSYGQMIGHHDSESYEVNYAVPESVHKKYKKEIKQAKSENTRETIQKLEKEGAVPHDNQGKAAHIQYYWDEYHTYYTMGVKTKFERYANKLEKPGLEKPKPVEERYFSGENKNKKAIASGYPHAIFRENKDDTITRALDVEGTLLSEEEIQELNERQKNGVTLQLK